MSHSEEPMTSGQQASLSKGKEPAKETYLLFEWSCRQISQQPG